jgi:hypothetical protein
VIYCFGNSHVSIFSGQDVMVPIWPDRSTDILPDFRTFRIGPVTAYQAVKHLDRIQDILNETDFKREEDTILFVFGEVDIRAHIVEQSKKQDVPAVIITKEVVNRYFEALNTMRLLEYNVVVFGCIAGFKLKEGGQEPPWPHSGTCKERNIITKVFNDQLERKCQSVNIPFISVFEEMLKSDGETKVKYLDTDGAGCHATTRMLPLILWKFRDAGLIPWK